MRPAYRAIYFAAVLAAPLLGQPGQAITPRSWPAPAPAEAYEECEESDPVFEPRCYEAYHQCVVYNDGVVYTTNIGSVRTATWQECEAEEGLARYNCDLEGSLGGGYALFDGSTCLPCVNTDNLPWDRQW